MDRSRFCSRALGHKTVHIGSIHKFSKSIDILLKNDLGKNLQKIIRNTPKSFPKTENWSAKAEKY